MSGSFHTVTSADVNSAMADDIESAILDILPSRGLGHCMRITDIDTDVMIRVAENLSKSVAGQASVHVLAPARVAAGNSMFITSTKLVELRNPLPDGTQRVPLLVFVPNEIKAAAEDSFGEATFESLEFSGTYERIVTKLKASLPAEIDFIAGDVLDVVRHGHWRWGDVLSAVRYLLCLKLNDYDKDVAGAALFEFGLVPDLRLLDDPTRTRNRVARNLEAVRKLVFSSRTERGRVLELGLSDREYAARLAEALITIGSDNPMVWTKRFIEDPELRDMTFDKWVFGSGEAGAGRVCVQVLQLGVEVLQDDRGDPRLVSLVGQKVLLVGTSGQSSLRVKFSCDPHPAKAAYVHHFKLQIVSRETGPTGLVKQKERWEGGKPENRVTFGNLRKHAWEEGWHFVRVTAYTEAGDQIPLVDERGKVLENPKEGDEPKPAFNESDLFYVLKSDEYEIEPAQKVIAKSPSRAHAEFSLKFKALLEERSPDLIKCNEVAWVDEVADGSLRAQELLELHFGREGAIHVPLSRVLRIIEQRILQSPDSPISWRVRIESGTPTAPQDGLMGWPDIPAAKAFLECRKAYFTSLQSGDHKRITQAADMLALHPQAVAYAEGYLNLLTALVRRVASAPDGQKASAIAELQKAVMIDAVSLELTDHRTETRSAVLLGPTHPLRVIWLITWSYLGQEWLKAATQSKSHITSVRDSLLERLSLAGFPAVLPVGGGKIYAPVDNIHPFWSLYAATTDPDPRGIVAEVCTALSLPEPALGSFSLTGGYLADRIRRYLVQHPYVQTLVLNCFNAGRGKVLADTLLELQKFSDLADLTYDLRVFVPDPDLAGIGDDLGELISPSSSLTAQEADPFAQPSGRLLLPKLSYSVRSITEYTDAAGEFPAHVSLLFDVFPAQEIGAVIPKVEDEAAPIHGLLQDYSVSYQEDGDMVSWQRRPRHAVARQIEGAEDLTLLLSKLASSLSSAVAAVATQETGIEMRPVSRLVLTAKDKALLHQVHEFSDWVFTVDRNLGIEFFDNVQSSRNPDYLIDHSPDIASNSGRRVVVTSRSLTEIEALFSRALEDYGLPELRDRSAELLAQLRALSGRLALKLLSSPTQRAEAVGLALAKIFLGKIGALANQVVVPLDAHLELFRSARGDTDPFADEVFLRRTDVALFDLNAREMLITVNLVEVKCYKSTGSIAAFARLRESIADQIGQSEEAIKTHWDPELGGANDRADRVIKTQELRAFLEFYVDRAARLGLLGDEAKNEAKFLLRKLEDGYRLRFTRSAVIFDFEQEGADAPIEEHGIEFHRHGRDVVRSLIQGLQSKDRRDLTGEFDEALEKSLSQTLGCGEGAQQPTAAFLPQKRDRSVSWDDVDHSAAIAAVVEPSSKASAVDEVMNPKDAQTPRVIPPLVDDPAPYLPPTPPKPPEPPKPKADSKPAVTISVTPVVVSSGPTPCDILVGASSASPQFGVLGRCSGRTVALDLNQTHTISIFGVQGGGKSYTVGSVLEMALKKVSGINELPSPLGAVVFHYSQTQDYQPEFTSMRYPNDDQRAIASLIKDYRAAPAGIDKVVLLTAPDKLDERKLEYPDIEVLPLRFGSAELQASHWRFLMDAVGNQAAYIRQLTQIMRMRRNNLTLEVLRADIDASSLPDALKNLAQMRLNFAAAYIDDTVRLSEVLKPGRLVIVDLRDEFIEKDEALGLFVVLLQIFSASTDDGKRFNKVVVFDEAHKYIQDEELIGAVVEVVREMRHKGTSVIVASQDPLSVPISLIELSSTLVLHKFNSPGWMKHIQKAITALANLTPEQLGRLVPGEAYVWAKESTDLGFTREAMKIQCRPRFSKHGGGTKTAVGP